MTHIHPHHSVNVTPAREPHRSAYVGQGTFELNGVIYGGTLCQVCCTDPDESNRRAQWLADAWNATAQLREEISSNDNR